MMDSVTRLDSALFQLTPTRTRFDLVLFRGNKSEKLASGLFDPFVSHLKFARDQISKGGYSISLRPPTNDASWFTKATFERFVRFVNTPAIIERFVSLEKEILQIGHSIQANDANAPVQPEDGSNLKKSNDRSKLQSGSNENDEGVQEETSRIQLQRLLETRKTLLRREQAMAYARGVVAGFEMDGMDSLISFADAFGASRLRVACSNYKDLWMKKHGDGIWMAELAAVQASSPSEMPGLVSSGIILTNEMNGLTSNGTESATTDGSPNSKTDSVAGKFQAPMLWPNQMPAPYFYNFGAPNQQIPPYQAYPFPPMHLDPHQYSGYMQRPPKGKSSNKKGSESYESSESETESDDDSASSVEDQENTRSKNKKDQRQSRRKNRNKSSKTVIIRNINYITPEGRNDDVEHDDDELMEQVSAVGLLCKEKQGGAKRDSENGVTENGSEVRNNNGNWDTFQNFLTRDEAKEKSQAANIGEEQFSSTMSMISKNIQTEGKISADSFLVTQMSRENDVRASYEDFANGESVHNITRKTGSAENNLLLPARSELFGSESNNPLFANEANGSVIKSGRAEDWFVANHDAVNQPKTFDGDLILSSESMSKTETDKSRKEKFIDDSFMVQHPFQTMDVYDSRLIPDASMVADMENRNAKTQQENHEVDVGEPNDLFMVLERNSGSAEYSWDLDYEAELFVAEANGRRESAQRNKEDEKNVSNGEKTGSLKNGRKDIKSRLSTGSLAKNRAEIMSRVAKRPSLVSRTATHKSKFEKEDDMRKRMEELAIERQKRIAERTAASAGRRVSMNGKIAKGPNSTSDKNRTNRTTPLC